MRCSANCTLGGCRSNVRPVTAIDQDHILSLMMNPGCSEEPTRTPQQDPVSIRSNQEEGKPTQLQKGKPAGGKILLSSSQIIKGLSPRSLITMRRPEPRQPAACPTQVLTLIRCSAPALLQIPCSNPTSQVPTSVY